MLTAQIPLGCEHVARAGDSRGSGRFLGWLPFRAESRVPAPEGVLPFVLEHPGPYLQQQMRSPRAPAHLLLLHHPLAEHLIDCRFHEP
jgi:hypothetical protein